MRRKYADVLGPRARQVVLRWVATLPASGWSGEVEELYHALQKHVRVGDYIGPNCSNVVERALVGTDWRLIRTRTSEARLVAVRRVGRQ
jgi:hypothetical protein